MIAEIILASTLTGRRPQSERKERSNARRPHDRSVRDDRPGRDPGFLSSRRRGLHRRSSRPAPTAARNASSSPIAAISPRMCSSRSTRHFAKADPSVIMGVGSVVDAPTAGIFIANGAKFVVGPLTQPRRRQAVQPPQDPLQPRLRLGDRDRLRRRARLRDRQGVPRRLGRRAGIRQGDARPLPVDAHHADRRRRRDRGIADQMVQGAASPASASART